MLGCRITRSVLLVLTYLVSVGVCFLVWFRFIFFPFRCRSQRCYLQRHIESLTGNLGVLSNDGFIKKWLNQQDLVKLESLSRVRGDVGWRGWDGPRHPHLKRSVGTVSGFGTAGIASSGTPRMWSSGKIRWDVLCGASFEHQTPSWCSLESVGMATGSNTGIQIPSQTLIATSSLYFHCG